MKSTCVLAIPVASAQNQEHGLPRGTEIKVKVRTGTVIPAKPPANQQHTATVSNDVMNSSGASAISRGAHARLLAIGPLPDSYPTRTPSENSNEEEI
jgi:hypothetical protein